jgi:hypothetical protein
VVIVCGTSDVGPLQEATRHGASESEVRNILTLWGNGRILNDYAAKVSCLVSSLHYVVAVLLGLYGLLVSSCALLTVV